MSQGITITNGKDIGNADNNDLVMSTKFASGMKIKEVVTIKRDGTRTLVSNFLGLYAFIKKVPHNLDYVPVYLAYKIIGDAVVPTLFTIPYNDFVGTGGGSDFAQVDNKNIIVGFDETAGADYIKVIIFEEKLSD